jgi:hypothetical protein
MNPVTYLYLNICKKRQKMGFISLFFGDLPVFENERVPQL